MGASTVAKLNNSISIQPIEEVIKQHYEYINTKQYADNSYYINFKNGDNHRSLHVYIGYNYGTETEISKWLSLGANAEAIQIMETILSYFGGWLTKNDCEQEYQWINKTRDLTSNKTKEIDKKSYISSKLSSIFSYDEIQKIIANEDIIKDALNYFDNKNLISKS